MGAKEKSSLLEILVKDSHIVRAMYYDQLHFVNIILKLLQCRLLRFLDRNTFERCSLFLLLEFISDNLALPYLQEL